MDFYGNAADFKTYHENRGKTIPVDWSDDEIEAALLISSEWLDGQYDCTWSGYPTDGFTQNLKWPRTVAMTNTFPQYIFATDEIPANVVKAVYEAAYRQQTTPGILQKDFTPNKYNKVSVDGAISVEYNSSMFQASDSQIQIPIIDTLMQPLLDITRAGYSSPYSGGVNRV